MLLSLIFMAQATQLAASKPPIWKNAEVAIDHAPMAALRGTKGGTISFFLDISPDGKVSKCRVTESSGTPGLDKASCDVLLRYAEFEPARGADGTAVTGIFRTATSYQADPRTSLGTALAQTITVKRLPSTYRQPARSEVLFDEKGGASGCVNVTSSGAPALDRVACDLIRQQVRIAPPRSGSDQPAVAVRWVTTSFTASSGEEAKDN